MDLMCGIQINKQVKVSFVIITKNEELHIGSCIDSIIRNHQPYHISEIEIIIIDSNSTDNTRDIVMDLRKTITNIQLYNITESSQYSASLSRSIGAELSKGKYILFLDGDMELQHGFLESSSRFFKNANEEVIGLIGIRNDYYYKNRKVSEKVFNIYNNFGERECKHFGGAVIFNSKKLLEVGGYDKRILASEEPELYLRIKENNYKVFELPIEMIIHHIDKGERTSFSFKSIFSKRTIGLGQTFYKSLKEKRMKYLFKHKHLAVFFIPFANTFISLILIIIYLITQEVILLYSLFVINLMFLLFAIKQKSFKKSVFVTLNFFTILRGIFTFRKLTYEIKRIF
ncbi:hypothetical protein CSV78_04110 [Sporosarcina sp. P16a]|uniref:glycosyltransferase n=1 Tax=unclassified Sporosarcina TaxID=2647733 RepID=UPI000C168D19|nr:MULTISPECIES: glycosyltransferase [unclassified Sporosarcina]PIC67984.1 hypothetical protein CSV78_04110 [Sporosarcina sp. P16a]PIC94293.1 hypothetical protein CSV70_00750 [Sporosarcina sp. P25]